MAKQTKSNATKQIRGAHPPMPTFSFRVFRAPISTIMDTNVVTVFRGLSVEGLLLIFLEDDLRRAPVVDERSRLVGFVSFSDLVIEPNEEQAESEDLLRVPLQSGGSYHLSSEFHLENPKRTVEDIMTAPPACLPPSATMSLAAALMAHEGCSALPVVDADRRVIGLLTARALLRWLAQADDYLIPERSSHTKHWTGWDPSNSGRFGSRYGAVPTAAEILDTTVVDASVTKR